MTDYSIIKLIHVSCVGLSLIGFTLRALLMLKGSSLLRRRWMRTVPHIVDSTLFFSGLGLAYYIQQYPGTSAWLSAKFIALVMYIIFGAMALRGKTVFKRYSSLILAYLCFAYMVSLAITKSPLLWLQ